MNIENIDQILQVIEGSETREDYFFGKASTMEDPFPLLKPLKERGYFEPEKNPLPQEDPEKKGYYFIPRWNVLGYLESVSAKNANDPNAQITEILIEIIDLLIANNVDNYRTNQSLIKIIFDLPIKFITKNYVDFIKTSLESKWNISIIESQIKKIVLPTLLNNKSMLTIDLLNILLDYRKEIGQNITDYHSILNEYKLNKILEEYKPKIASLYDIKAAEVGIDKISSIIEEDHSQFNYVSIPTIEDNFQTRFPEDYDCQLVYFVRDMLNNSDPIKIKDTVIDLKEKKHSIFKRIAINAMSNHFEELNSLFWEWDSNPLEKTDLKHEIYEFFESNALNFNPDQVSIIIGWIESKKYYISPEDKDYTNEIKAYGKKEWLSSLLNSKNKEITELYNKYNEINTSELEHPGFNFWIGGLSPARSSLEKSDFLAKSNEEIANYLINYKKEGPLFSETKLSRTLKDGVSEDPDKFAENLTPFLEVKYLYQYAILWGLQEAWQEKRKFDWKPVLDFISEIIQIEEFWVEYGKDHYVNAVVSSIADLIEEGTKNHENIFDLNLLPQSKKILLILAKKTPSNLKKTSDLIIEVLNSEKGKIFSAMISYSLIYAHIYQNEELKWDNDIKNDFSRRLDKYIEPPFEFIVTVAKYLHNLFYLDNEWVIDNINQIFDIRDDIRWNAAFTGYLFYSYEFYENIYNLLKREGHYDKAIETNFDDKRINERLVQHICSFYLQDKEDLADETSLISKLIENRRTDHLLLITKFFWINREELVNYQKTKVKPLWGKLFDILSQDEEKKENQLVLSKLSKWLSLIDSMDVETFNWLKLSAKYVKDDMDYSFFIDYLHSHLNENPSEVGQLFEIMLENNIYTEFKDEETQEIVEFLYKNNYGEIANRICYLYERKGFEFLREIRVKYDKQYST